MASRSSSGNGEGLGRLLRRAEFLAAAAARRKWVAPGVILQARRRGEGETPDPGQIRIGFTASRKVGGAVERNRARRRLRAAAREVMPQAAPGYDFVLIARTETLSRPYGGLKQDLAVGLKRLGALRRDEANGSGEEARR